MLKKKISKATLAARGLFPSMIEEVFPIRLLVGFVRRVVNMESATQKKTCCDML